MIELKNVFKTYKSKKGQVTKALDDVSIKFPNKGMVFILGKSGSGKSTLLNILGGLDKYDEGDMLILNKSSKDFTIKDLDSYRNTYVGFIFQEFNVLEDYDVYENITLALKLQQKEIDNEKIDNLLAKLGIADLKQRKVNELSGGEKQRVAIARALIKDPKIILADEPTGNLDSKTSKEVMDLLKQIAKDRLVIIVSHDEEAAKVYSDRIIEIKDGKIIKDTSRKESNSNSSKDYQTIKSKLPLKDSFKLGIGNLKHKKGKLILTIILTIFTLGFLSASDTLSSFKYEKSLLKMFNETEDEFVEISNSVIVSSSDMEEKIAMPLTDEKENLIVSNMGKKGYTVYEFSEGDYEEEIFNIMTNNGIGYGSNGKVEIVATDNIKDILNEEIVGHTNLEANEVIISNYIANKMINNGVQVYELTVNNEFEKSHLFKPTNYEDILNSDYTFYFGSKGKVKIAGIINYDLSKIKKTFSDEYTSNVLNKIYVSPQFINNLEIDKNTSLNRNYYYELSMDKEEDIDIYDLGVINGEVEYFDGSKWNVTNSLNTNEVIISIDYLTRNDQNYYNNLNEYINSHEGDYTNLQKKFTANYIKNKNIIGKKINLKVYYNSFNEVLKETIKDITIVGIRFDNYYDESNVNQIHDIYFSPNLVKEYLNDTFTKISILYPVKDINNLKKLVKEYPYENELYLKTTYSETLYQESLVYQLLSKIAFYVSLVFLIFSIILIANFMFNSINYLKKEIGILRALGARSTDIIHIFLWEAFLISLISGTIASILLVIVSNRLNAFILSYNIFISAPFIVGVRQFLVIYLIVFGVTYFASLFPLIRISKMKPIDAITNK